MTLAVGKHLFPSRTEPLSQPAPMVPVNSGRVGRRQNTAFKRAYSEPPYSAAKSEFRLQNIQVSSGYVITLSQLSNFSHEIQISRDEREVPKKLTKQASRTACFLLGKVIL